MQKILKHFKGEKDIGHLGDWVQNRNHLRFWNNSYENSLVTRNSAGDDQWMEMNKLLHNHNKILHNKLWYDIIMSP